MSGFKDGGQVNCYRSSSLRIHCLRTVTHARDHWWTLDFANAFVSLCVNSRAELVPSHGASRWWLWDDSQAIDNMLARVVQENKCKLRDFLFWWEFQGHFLPYLQSLQVRQSFKIIFFDWFNPIVLCRSMTIKLKSLYITCTRNLLIIQELNIRHKNTIMNNIQMTSQPSYIARLFINILQIFWVVALDM
jgi:hypothetical protein